MHTYCIEGWRQQSRDREQILAWLSEARQVGFDRYTLLKQDACFWLCCTRDAHYDAVTQVRHRVALPAAVVVQVWQQRLIAIAWQGETLLGALTFSADEHGVINFLFIAEEWLAASKMACPLMVAGHNTKQLLAAHSKAENSIKFCDEVITDTPLKLAKLRSIKKSPAWLRRQVVLQGMTFAGLCFALVSWWFWPQSQPQLAMTETPIAAPSAAPIVGFSAAQLVHVGPLLSHVSHLAGWRVLKWEIKGNSELLQAQKSYGTQEELLAQLPSAAWGLVPRHDHQWLQRDTFQHQPLQITPPVRVEELRAVGFEIIRDGLTTQVNHREFRPLQAAQWQLFIRWLAQQPQALVTAATAVPSALQWRLEIQVEQAAQGEQR